MTVAAHSAVMESAKYDASGQVTTHICWHAVEYGHGHGCFYGALHRPTHECANVVDPM